MSGPVEVDETDEDREATERGRYLARRHRLREQVALAVAYRELGYTASGIAGKVDVTPSTVQAWLDDVAERFGKRAIETKWKEQRTGRLDQ